MASQARAVLSLGEGCQRRANESDERSFLTASPPRPRLLVPTSNRARICHLWVPAQGPCWGFRAARTLQFKTVVREKRKIKKNAGRGETSDPDVGTISSITRFSIRTPAKIYRSVPFLLWDPSSHPTESWLIRPVVFTRRRWPWMGPPHQGKTRVTRIFDLMKRASGLHCSFYYYIHAGLLLSLSTTCGQRRRRGRLMRMPSCAWDACYSYNGSDAVGNYWESKDARDALPPKAEDAYVLPVPRRRRLVG